MLIPITNRNELILNDYLLIIQPNGANTVSIYKVNSTYNTKAAFDIIVSNYKFNQITMDYDYHILFDYDICLVFKLEEDDFASLFTLSKLMERLDLSDLFDAKLLPPYDEMIRGDVVNYLVSNMETMA